MQQKKLATKTFAFLIVSFSNAGNCFVPFSCLPNKAGCYFLCDVDF